MKTGERPKLIGVYLVWRRWTAVVGLGGLVLGTVAAARVFTWGAAGSMGTILGSLTVSVVAAGVIGWFGVRRLRRPVRVLVSSRGIVLEPIHGGPSESWRWDELELSLYEDDEDGTLQLDSRSGSFLLARDSGSAMAPLIDAIARAGGRVT